MTYQHSTRIAAAAALVMLACPIALADQWRFEPELQTTVFTFGPVQIIRSRDARKDQQQPDFTVEIKNRGETVGLYRGIWFDVIVPDKNNEVFLGLSNTGLPNTAIVRFSASGEITWLTQHGRFMPEYCDESVTLVKVWFDESDAGVEFEYELLFDDYEVISDIRIRLCNGEVVSILDVLFESDKRRVRATQEYRDRTQTKAVENEKTDDG